MLSISRVPPIRAATSRRAGRFAELGQRREAVGIGQLGIVDAGETAVEQRLFERRQRRAATGSPPSIRGDRLAHRARQRRGARAVSAARGSGCGSTARARRPRAPSARRGSPSACGRTRSRSRAMRRITASCCQSFSPNSARSGRTWLNSLHTTVATPSKWPGREAPHSPSLTPAHRDVGGKAVGIDLRRRRRPQQVDPFGFEQRANRAASWRG